MPRVGNAAAVVKTGSFAAAAELCTARRGGAPGASVLHPNLGRAPRSCAQLCMLPPAGAEAESAHARLARPGPALKSTRVLPGCARPLVTNCPRPTRPALLCGPLPACIEY